MHQAYTRRSIVSIVLCAGGTFGVAVERARAAPQRAVEDGTSGPVLCAGPVLRPGLVRCAGPVLPSSPPPRPPPSLAPFPSPCGVVRERGVQPSPAPPPVPPIINSAATVAAPTVPSVTLSGARRDWRALARATAAAAGTAVAGTAVAVAAVAALVRRGGKLDVPVPCWPGFQA